MLLLIWSEGLKRGGLRQQALSTHSAVMDFLKWKGEWREIVNSIQFLRRAAESDAATIFRAHFESNPPKLTPPPPASSSSDQAMSHHNWRTLNDSDLVTFALRAIKTPIVTPSPVLHLDPRIWHQLIEAEVALGRTDALLHILNIDLRRQAELVRLLPNTAAWSERDTRTLQASDYRPSTHTLLLCARQAFRSSRYDEARRFFLQAWEEAEADWGQKEVRLTQLGVLSSDHVPSSLAQITPATYSSLHELLHIFHLTLPSERIDSLPEVDLRRPLPDAAKVDRLLPIISTDDIPQALYITREDMWMMAWTVSAIGRMKIAAAATAAASSSPSISPLSQSPPVHPNLDIELRHTFNDATRRILYRLLEYSRNSVWLSSWLMGRAAESLHESSYAVAPSLSPKVRSSIGHGNRAASSGRHQHQQQQQQANYFIPVPKSVSPAQILQHAPSATLEIIGRYLSHAHAYHTLATLYLDGILPSTEVANQEIVQRMLSDSTVELVDIPIGSRPAFLRSYHRLRYRRRSPISKRQPNEIQPDLMFTVATVPPAEYPPIPVLSQTTQDMILGALTKLAAIGQYHVEFVQFLLSRAYIHTFYVNGEPAPGTIFHLHASSALRLKQLVSALYSLPSASWQLAHQIIERVGKGVLLPVIEYMELQSTLTPGLDELSPDALFHFRNDDVRRDCHLMLACLMRRYFEGRKYAALIGVSENDQARQFDPPITSNHSQVLMLIQAYTWMGNLSSSLELVHRYQNEFTPTQRVCVMAFMCHFLEAHVLKSIQQMKRKADRMEVLINAPRTSMHTAPSSLHAGVRVGVEEMHLSTSNPSQYHLPLPHLLPLSSISSMGAPILTSNGEPMYHTDSGFTHLLSLDIPSSPSSTVNPHDETQWEIRKVESWKVRMNDLQQERSQMSGLSRRSHHYETNGFIVPVGQDAFDPIEFLQAPTSTSISPYMGRNGLASANSSIDSSNTSSSSDSLGYLVRKDSPQFGIFSFGLGSPSFSTFATNTAVLVNPAMQADGKRIEIDPLVGYQVNQIQALLEEVRNLTGACHSSRLGKQ